MVLVNNKMEASFSLCVRRRRPRLCSTFSTILLCTVWLLSLSSKRTSAENEVTETREDLFRPGHLDVRLKGGNNSWEGRIEIYIRSEDRWFTHCETPRRVAFYHTVCRALGFGSFLREHKFPPSDYGILNGHFECNDDSKTLRDCWWSQGSGCDSNEEEIGIVCSGEVPSCGPITFQHGNPRVMSPFLLSYPVGTRVSVGCPSDPSISGGVMICVNGHWEWEGEEPEPCPPQLDDTVSCQAPVIDQQFTFLDPWKITYQYGEAVDIVCRDRSLTSALMCGSNGRLVCRDDLDTTCVPAAPECTTQRGSPADENVVLVGGAKPTKGRVLVRREDGRWGSICADEWDFDDARVVCAQLGFGPPRPLVKSPRFPPGDKLYFFGNVDCSVKDTEIQGCKMRILRPSDKCVSDVEVEVDCYPEELPPNPITTAARTSCGPPGLPPFARLEPFKFVYEAGETVNAACLKNRGVNPTVHELMTLTCASDGLWRGAVINCREVLSNEGPVLFIGLVIMQVISTAILYYFLKGPIAPATEVHDDAPPPNDDDAKDAPANQEEPLMQPQAQAPDEIHDDAPPPTCPNHDEAKATPPANQRQALVQPQPNANAEECSYLWNKGRFLFRNREYNQQVSSRVHVLSTITRARKSPKESASSSHLAQLVAVKGG